MGLSIDQCTHVDKQEKAIHPRLALTFIVLKRHVLMWSPVLMSILISRLNATPSSSSFRWPMNLTTNSETP